MGTVVPVLTEATIDTCVSDGRLAASSLPGALFPSPKSFRLTGGRFGAPHTEAVDVRVPGGPAQGYALSISPSGIAIRSSDEAGAFYAGVTLAQMRRMAGAAALPCCEVEDWPDYPVRGVMLDISRNKVPTMDTLEMLVDELASIKINHIELYTEHTFAYEEHRTVWREASPMTPAEIRRLDAYCHERFIDLVPNQNSFGHFERWLCHPAYKPLAECPDGFDRHWGGRSPCGTTLCPIDPMALRLVEALHAELLPNFTSRKFNVGCDETWELGLGRSRAECERVGKGRVYMDFLRKIHASVARHGRAMHFWGDIVLQHPELASEIPPEAVVLEWGYEAAHPFEEHGRLFEAAGRSFYVCPGTSSWNSIAGRTDNCLANVRNAAASGLNHGALGLLVTDWGDNGHWQYLPVSYLGFAAAAGLAWNRKAHAADDFTEALDRHIFHDRAGIMGRLAHDLGNVHLRSGSVLSNASAPFSLLQRDHLDNPPPGLADMQAAIDQTMATLPDAVMDRPDAALIRDEFVNAARMLRHACARGLREPGGNLAAQIAAIQEEHRRLWLARNRPGGLQDSVALFERRLREYEGRE